ncbi:hypothetical protein GRI75_01265 [Altererythrobacter soli]|uniref:O-antigen ligase-related domain-containing protein n=1 Tax=Croceibacterium soli TaxID=1739690 RepID=A0A6I4UND5_9SPHN|nr:O-antigen ligase family protein [Croceibacterium soli]MXP40272.1 hypothetical protein [Croceibacterium soli]
MVFVGWYAASILWAEDKMYALQYCAYVVLATLTVLYTTQICRSPSRLTAAFKLVFLLISVEIFLSALEGLGLIRLPFSPYSQYYAYFGREPEDLSGFGVWASEYIASLPTGFFSNPNNLAAFLALALPFFALHQKWLVRIVATSAILYIVYMCGARSVLVACGLTLTICVFVWGGIAGRFGGLMTASLVVTIVGAGTLDLVSGSSNTRILELEGLGGAIGDFWASLRGDAVLVDSSTGARAQLIRNGLDALYDSGGLGVGAGGSWVIQEKSLFQVREITSMHNFWIELLVEGGVLFALLFAAWYARFLVQLWKVAKSSRSPERRYLAKSLFAGFAGFIIGAIGPSTVIYMLPMWMLVGIGLSVIMLDSGESEIADSAKSSHRRPVERLAMAGRTALPRFN